MAIPDYESIILPLLKYIADGKEHSKREATDGLAKIFRLSDTERKELLPSGQQAVFDNRVGWARTYLKKAGLLESTKWGYFKITQRGLNVLQKQPPKIDVEFLKQFSEFAEFKKITKKKKMEVKGQAEFTTIQTPEELLETGYNMIRQELIQELLKKTKGCSPDFFERLVIELLINMGYGGSRQDAGKAIGKSGDGGIDGIINEDRLGLDNIYIQAKRWGEGVVGSPEIQKFVGALAGKKAKKGIFITTSTFSKNAIDYAASLENKVVLIGGEQLANLMIDFNVGVSKYGLYEIKKIDTDYFSE
jgi:restriction system protein